MAVTDSYAEPEDYLAVFPNAGDDDEVELLRQMAAVSRWIEGPSACGQFFTKDAAAVVRIYMGDGSNRLWLGENLAASPTSLKYDSGNDGTYATTITTFELWPFNAADGPEPRPYRRIDLPPWGTYTTFPANTRVQVTAQFGWPSVPEAVRQACIHLTAILRLQSPRATTSVDQIGNVIGMSAQARDIVAELLKAYPKLPVVG